jgi:RNA polymerase sigma-70 factor (ECF subfamily)
LVHAGYSGLSWETHAVALSEIDRNLLSRCLARKPRAWDDFVDRFMGLVIHVINHSAQSRSIRLTAEDREDLAADVFLTVVKDEFAVLRHFRGESSLATYLTVVTRRVVVQQLLKHKSAARLTNPADEGGPVDVASIGTNNGEAVERVQSRDEIERLLEELEGSEADVVRMYHLDGKSYAEISAITGMPENSVGPLLSRARQKMRRVGVDPAVG